MLDEEQQLEAAALARERQMLEKVRAGPLRGGPRGSSRGGGGAMPVVREPRHVLCLPGAAHTARLASRRLPGRL